MGFSDIFKDIILVATKIFLQFTSNIINRFEYNFKFMNIIDNYFFLFL